MDDNVVIVVAPVKPGVSATADSVTITATCGHRAYISPQGLRAVGAHPNSITKCMDCIPAQEAFGGRVASVPGGIEAAARHLGRDPQEISTAFHRAVRKHGGSVEPHGV